MCCHGNKVHGWYHITRVAYWRKDDFEVHLLLCFIFFSNDANGTSNFADFLTNMCISNCVRSVFFFFKPWLALSELDFCYCEISNWYFWQLCGWSFILGLQIIVIIITDQHEFKFSIVSVFFPFIFYSFCCLLLLFLFFPCFYCLSCLLNLSNYKHNKMLD